MRVAIGVEYAGTRYSGWQRQDAAVSVQGEVERALGRVADHPVAVVCAGRTDTGVHALGQVVHFDTKAYRSPRSWTLGANTHLPPDVAVTWAAPVAEDFHARFAALSRTYRYVILNRAARSALWRERCCWWHPPLDAARMHAAAQAFVGTHDFSAFRAAECQSRVPIRRLDRVDVRRVEDRVIVEVTANAFLHHMVRNLVGTLLHVGEGSRPVEWPAELLAGRDRRVAGPTAPAAGLYFLRVEYPARFGLPPDTAAPVPAPAPGPVGPAGGAFPL